MKPVDYAAAVFRDAPDQCTVHNARELLLPGDCKRGKDGPARLTLAVPDLLVKALRGPPDKARHDVLVMVIPRGALEEPVIMAPDDPRARRIR